MKYLRAFLAGLLIVWLDLTPLQAQPMLIQPDAFKPRSASGISNLRLVKQSADGTEVIFAMDFVYDGLGGATAQVIPVIEKRGQKGVAAWFGADPITVGQGQGPMALMVKYFNDEPGVPPQLTTDRIRVLFLNNSGTAIIGSSIFIKTIHWGSPDAKPVPLPAAPTALAPSTPVPAEAIIPQRQAEEVAQAKARAEAPLKAEAKAKKLAEQRVKAEAQAQDKARLAAEAKAQAAAQLKAEAEAKRLTKEKRLAESQAKAEAELRERARLKAEAEEKVRLAAEVKAQKEAAAREAARLKAESEAKRFAEEKRIAEESRVAKEKRIAAAKPQAEAARSTVQPAPAKLEPPAVKPATVPAPASAPLVVANANMKTKITSVDVVNRSLDRTKMTIGVEFEYKDSLGKPMLGVDVTRTSEPEASKFFNTNPAEIGRSRRNFVLLPVKFQPPTTLTGSFSSYSTDQLMVYLAEGTAAQRFNLFAATMLLMWRPPWAGPSSPAQVATGDSLDMDDFKQNDLYTGYVMVRYNLVSGPGKLRLRLFNSSLPASADYFIRRNTKVPAGRNLQLLEIAVRSDAPSPSEEIKVDTLEIELLDNSGKVVARSSKKAPMTWAKPK